jgi:hypothetical protein
MHADTIFRMKHPNAPGRLVVQDLPPVIDGIEMLHPHIERMKYDFHTEQPMKGTSENLEMLREDTDQY